MQATQVITVGAPAAPAAAVTGTLTNTAATTGTAPITGTAGLTATGALTATGTVTAPATVAAAPAVTPMLEIETDIINVRSGPGTTFGLVGTANVGERFEIKGRNADATWYLICCVNGQQGWVSADFADEENEELAQLVEVPTPAPQAQAPAPTQPPAAPPAAPPAEATATPAPAPPPSADDCAGIGGDGCKFKLRGGPTFAGNGGNELKFQIAFVHSGVEGGQPQGSYFVWVEKDGQKLPVSDSVRSISLQAQQGPQGKYNYEYKIGRDQLPGGSVAGNYRIWVLDGNGERDSQTFSFTVPEGQGEVWILFDQA
jgi:SH3-like domain-containing protein